MKEEKDLSGYYALTDNLKIMINRANLDQKQMIVQGIHFYKEQYRIAKESGLDSKSIAVSFHNSIDEIIKEELPNSVDPITCKKGCFFCCLQRVTITIEEAELLLEYANHIDYKIDWDRIDKQANKKTEEEFDKLSLEDRKCVFLSKSGECSVYEHRPLACRQYHVITPKEDCDPVVNPHGQVGRFNMTYAEIVTSGAWNSSEIGNMAEMLLKVKNK
jgi:Fe-S-cluster containining protein